jgi:hypothetical protein
LRCLIEESKFKGKKPFCSPLSITSGFEEEGLKEDAEELEGEDGDFFAFDGDSFVFDEDSPTSSSAAVLDSCSESSDKSSDTFCSLPFLYVKGEILLL